MNMIPILFEDNHLLVVLKPPNIPSQEDESGDMDMLRLLKQDIKERYQKPGNVYLGLVHRLDRPVSGVMVFAKTSKAASRLSNQVRERTFQKIYIAVVQGRPPNSEGKLIHYLKKDEKTNTSFCVDKSDFGAKEAILDYQLKGQANGYSLIQIKLQTGRSHQIRVQFNEIGCPLYGDQKYGARTHDSGQQIALWSMMVGFHHPTSKKELQFHAFPSDFSATFPWTLWSQTFYKELIPS